MRLCTRALLAVLLVLLPSGSDTSFLPHGDPTQLVNLRDVTPFWSSQESNSRALASSSYQQQQLDAYGTSHPSRAVPGSASGSQLQAYRGPEWVDQFSRELRRGMYEAAQPSPSTQQAIARLRRKHPGLQVIADDSNLFQGSSRTWYTVPFSDGTDAQRAWILNRFHQLSVTEDHDASVWLPNVAHYRQKLKPAEATTLLANFRTAKKNSGQRFQPYIVGDKLIIFQQKNGVRDNASVYYVYAVPVHNVDNRPEYTVVLVGALNTLAKRGSA